MELPRLLFALFLLLLIKVPDSTKTIPHKSAEIYRSVEDNGPSTFDDNDFDFDGCNIIEVIMFLQKLAKLPKASEMNIPFTKHITKALMHSREEKLKHEASIPRKL